MPPENPIKTQKLKVGASPLMEAALKCGVKKCKNLVDNGADLNEKTKEHAVSVMHFAAANKKHGVELVKYFASLGCKLDAKDSGREEPIDYAIREEAFAVAKEILTLLYPCSNLLQFCVMQRNLVVAKRVHDLYPELANELTSEGSSIIHFAAYFADRRMCEWLIDEVGVDVHSVTKLNRTVLFYVGYNKEHGGDLVKFFFDRGFDVNEICSESTTAPIHQAINKKNVRVIDALIECNADLKIKYCDLNLAYYCLILGNTFGLKLLLEKDKDLFNELYLGQTIAQVAASSADLEVFKWLIEEAKVDKTVIGSDTLLHIAGTNTEFGKNLIDYMISTMQIYVNKSNNSGVTPLMVALYNNNPDVVEELCKHGAVSKEVLYKIYEDNHLFACVRCNYLKGAKFVHQKDPTLIHQEQKHGMSILHVAANFAGIEICQWLIEEQNIDPLELSQFNKLSALHFAALNFSHGEEVIPFFHHNLKSLNRKFVLGQTPILLAIKAGNVCAVEKLCQLGANLSVTYNGVNLVHQCIYLDNLDVAKLLCSFSDTLVSVKSPIGGKTALHVAAELGNDRFCEWLVEEEGVDVKEKTAKGETAADLVPWFNLHLLKYLKIVALK